MRKPNLSAWASGLLAVVSAAHAQSLVIPAAYATQEAGAVTDVAGFSDAFRQQILVRGDLLAAQTGKKITALWFRRDHALHGTVQAETARIKVTVSDGARDPAQPVPAFAQNHGPSPTVVFDSTLALPPSLGMNPPYPWQAPYAIQIPFAPVWTYQGGHVCIEIEGAPQSGQPGANWWVDSFVETTGSTVTSVSSACGATAARGPKTLYARPRTLQPGGSLLAGMFGQAGSTGALFLGVSAVQWPLDPFGAVGCTLTVAPQSVVAAAFPAYGVPDTLWSVRLPVPADPRLLGGSFYLQGMNFEVPPVSNAAGLTTTNGLHLRIGTTMPAATMSMVASQRSPGPGPSPTAGEIALSRGPVLRFDVQ